MWERNIVICQCFTGLTISKSMRFWKPYKSKRLSKLMDWILRKHLSIFYKFPYFHSTWIDLAYPKTQHRVIVWWSNMKFEHTCTGNIEKTNTCKKVNVKCCDKRRSESSSCSNYTGHIDRLSISVHNLDVFDKC